MNHLLERFRDGRNAIADFTELKHRLESDIDVPRECGSSAREIHACGDGEMPKTFLSPEMIARGKEIH